MYQRPATAGSAVRERADERLAGADDFIDGVRGDFRGLLLERGAVVERERADEPDRFALVAERAVFAEAPGCGFLGVIDLKESYVQASEETDGASPASR